MQQHVTPKKGYEISYVEYVTIIHNFTRLVVPFLPNSRHTCNVGTDFYRFSKTFKVTTPPKCGTHFWSGASSGIAVQLCHFQLQETMQLLSLRYCKYVKRDNNSEECPFFTYSSFFNAWYDFRPLRVVKSKCVAHLVQ